MKRIVFILALVTVNFGIVFSQHFTKVVPEGGGNGPSQMNFNVTSAIINGVNLQVNDEVAVFDGNYCVGVGIVTSPGAYLYIITQEDIDGVAPWDGYTLGHTATLKIWDASRGIEITDIGGAGGIIFIGGNTAWLNLTATVTCTPPAAPTVGTITQPTCSESTGSVVLSGLPSGNWTINPGDIDGSGSSTTVPDLTSGTYNFTVTDEDGCTSDASEVVINPQPVTPTAPTVGTITQPTCTEATASVVLGGLPSSGTWTLTRTPGGNTYSSTGTSYTVTGLGASTTYTFTVTNASGCISGSSGNVVVNAQPSAPSAATASVTVQPTCAVATGTAVVSAPIGAYEYNIDGGTYQSSVTFTGVSPGSHTILVRRTSDNTCISDPTTVTVNAQPSAPPAATASVTVQPTCAAPTATIVVSNPTGSYQYNIDGGSYQSSTTFAGVSPGSHTILVRSTSDNTCISDPATVTVSTPSAPSAATASVSVQPTCAVATGTVLISAPIGAYEYNIDGGTYQSSVTFTGVSSGLHTILVRRTTDNTCISSPTTVTVNDQPSSPPAATASVTVQPTCAVATGTVVVSAPIGAYEYNIDDGTYQSSLTFTGVTPGSHTILVRRTGDNTCISDPTTVTVNAQPSAPPAATASVTVQATCSLPTATITVSAPTGAYQYNIDGGTYQSSVTFTGVTPGSHTILVRRTGDNTCISAPTIVSVSAPAIPSAATASVTVQPTCAAPTATIVVSNPTGSYQYNIDGGTYQSSTTFAGVSPGSHTILVRSTSDNTCISDPTTITVSTPSVPSPATASVTVQPTCAVATGTVVVSAPTGAYEYNIDGGTYQSSVTFTGVSPGSHTILVRRTSDNTCISSPTTVTVNAQPSAPPAATASVTVQPTCAVSTGTVVVSAPTGAYQYNIDGGTYQSSVTFTGVTPGSHTILVRRTSDNTCISDPTTVTVNTQPSAPPAATASVTVQPTCATPTATLVVSNPSGSYQYNIDGGTYQSSTAFAGVSPGSHTILVRSTSDNTCISDPTTITVSTPSAPSPATAGITVQPTCATPAATIVVSNPTGSYQYNIDGGTYQSSTTFAGVSPGSHTILVRRTSDNTCISSPTIVTVSTPSAPTAATASVTVQPTCAVATGTVVVSAPTGAYEYKIDGGTYQSSVTFTGVNPGSHTILVRRSNDISCISLPTTVTVNAQPSAPQAATAGITVQPTCAAPTATIVVSNPTGSYQYNIDGGTYQSSTTFTGVSPGSHTILVRRTSDNTCISDPTTVTVSTPSAPQAASASVTVQPTCATPTATIVVSNPTGSYQYNIDGGTYQSSTTFAGVSPGSHTILVRSTSDNTCISSPTIVNVSTPSAPSAATASVTVQPTCAVSTGTVVVSAPTGAYEYNIDGGTYQSSVTFTGISSGLHTILVRRTTDNTCISSPTTVTVNAQPTTPSAPLVGAITQPDCSVATGSVVLSGLPSSGTWTLTRTPGGTTYSSTGTSYTASGIPPGTYTFIVTNAAGCMSGSSANVVINANPTAPSAPTVGTITQPTCTEATASVVLGGLPSTGSWTLTRSPGGNTYSSTGTSYTVTGLTAGTTYSFTITGGASGCTSEPSANVVINPQPSTPTAPTVGTITQPTCTESTASVLLGGLPSSGTWTLTRTPGGNTYSSTGTSYTVTGLAAATTFTFVVTNASGCTSGASANVVVNSQPATPSAPLVGTITQPTCIEATGSVMLNGLPSTGTWIITRSPGGNTYSSTGTSYTISGLEAGTYTFVVSNASGCTSLSSANAVIETQPYTSAPIVGTIIQPTCTEPTGSVTLNGLPSSGTWTLTRSPGGTTYSSTGTSYTVTGLAAGTTYTFDVTGGPSACTSSSSEIVVIHNQPETPSAPVVGTITQPTCAVATGSVLISGLPSSGTWTLTQTPGGTTYSSSGTSYTVSELVAGTYTFIVTNESGCTSGSSANVVVDANPATPSAPTVGTIIQPTCDEATGSVELSGLPSGDWIINPGDIDGSGASTTITDLVAGTYNFTVTNDAGCISTISADVVINAQPATPTAPTVGTVIQPTCEEATGSVELVDLPFGDWTINPGDLDGSGSSTTISDLVTGTYNYTVTNEDGCTSAASADVVIDVQPAMPSAPTVGTITQPTCLEATGSVELGDLPSGDWTINPGTISGSGAGTTISDLATGTYNFTVTNEDGCISTVSADVVIDAQPTTPPKPDIELLNDNLLRSDAMAGNQWYEEVTGIIDGATDQDYTVLVTGDYFTIVTNDEGCSSEPSDTLHVVILGISQPALSKLIKLYPNPTDGKVRLSIAAQETHKIDVVVMDILGQTLNIDKVELPNNQIELNLKDLSGGSYLIKITYSGNTVIEKVILKK